MNIVAQMESSPVDGVLWLLIAVIVGVVAVAGFFLPLVVWQMNNRMGRMEDRTIAMRRMMRLMEDHLRAIRVAHTGEELEPRDPAL